MSTFDETPHGQLAQKIAGVIKRNTPIRVAERNKKAGYFFVPVVGGVRVFYYDPVNDADFGQRQQFFAHRVERILTEYFGAARVTQVDEGNRHGFEVSFIPRPRHN